MRTASLADDGSSDGGGDERERVRQALRHFQLFTGLPQTGVLDVRTKRKMAQPRCGVTDAPAIQALTHRNPPPQIKLWTINANANNLFFI